MKKLFGIVVVLFFTGCATTMPMTKSLQEHFIQIGITPNEAQTLALESTHFAASLHHSYETQTSPWMHNFLVNVGLKSKGLCYHFAYDLFEHLAQLPHKSYSLHIIKAEKGSYFEHTAVAVCTQEVAFEECIVLDAWRDSKRLSYAQVKNDKYLWMRD
jgi:hypothetical protein